MTHLDRCEPYLESRRGMQKSKRDEAFAHNRIVDVAVFSVMKSRINKLFRLLPVLLVSAISPKFRGDGSCKNSLQNFDLAKGVDSHSEFSFLLQTRSGLPDPCRFLQICN